MSLDAGETHADDIGTQLELSLVYVPKPQKLPSSR